MDVSIYRKTAGELAGLLVEAAIDHEAFEQRLALCDLTKCRATCCHDGVILSREEADLIGEGVEEETSGRWRTRRVAATPDDLANDFPDHFPKTRCVFLDDEHRCQWQLKAVDEGRHPWFYKPTSCWMHPLVVEQRHGRPVLTILSREWDEAGFASYTPCGRAEETGVPARECLKAELEMLREISGRDFYGELNAPPAFS
ncbi:MAG: DUF3109 family protein [Akkermansiaceae bacterium]